MKAQERLAEAFTLWKQTQSDRHWAAFMQAARPIVANTGNMLGVRDYNDLEDLHSEVQLRLWTARHRINPKHPRSLSSYISRVARNYVYDQAGKRRLHTISLDEARLPPVNPPELPGYSEEMERQLGSIPEIHRQAFILRLHGLSYRDIGKELGLKIGTVKSRIRRARNQIDSRRTSTGQSRVENSHGKT